MTLDDFRRSLMNIPWLENLGRSNPQDGTVYRIYDWGTWMGPEDPAVVLQNAYYMAWKDQLEAAAGESCAVLWQDIYDQVFHLAQKAVPFEAEQDAYYGPNMAVWSCCWFAALAGCWLKQFESLAQPLKRPAYQTSSRYQWRIDLIWWWYTAGHWPCSFYWTQPSDMASAERHLEPKYLVVF